MAGTDAVTPEARWIAWLGTTNDPRGALRAFCPHYFYFSYRQVVAFSALFRQVDPMDRETLAMLADVLFEELGQGRADQVHSVLFERFAKAVGLEPPQLRRDPAEILPGVRAYVDELERAFAGESLPEALATYVFLETSAVDTYGPLVERLSQLSLGKQEVEFFERHAGVEPEHAAAADAMLRRYGMSVEDAIVAAQTERLSGLWNGFWTEIDEECRRAVAG